MSKKMMFAVAVVLLLVFQSFLMVAFALPSAGPKTAVEEAGRSEGRTQVDIWTETDWSLGKVNSSTDMELDLTPGEAVLASDIGDMVSSYSPVTGTVDSSSMVEFKGLLIVSYSTKIPEETKIFSCDPLTFSCSLITTLNESMVYQMTVNENGTRLYIPGGHQLNPAYNGSIYVFDGTSFTRFDVKDGTTRSVGVHSVIESGGKIYAASTDTDNRAYIYRSLDDGKTWIKVNSLAARPYVRSLNAMGKTGNTVLVPTDGLATEGPKVLRFNGSGWYSDPLPGMTDTHGAMTSIGGKPYLFVGDYLYSFNNNAWSEVQSPISPAVQRAEVYDTDTTTLLGSSSLIISRYGHTSDLTLGKVVTAGGMIGKHFTDNVELYDVATGNVTAAKSLGISRGFQASVVLNDGTVLVTGGRTGLPPSGYAAIASVERYNVSKNLWGVSSSLNGPRYNHTATKLNDGRVLVAGGQTGVLTALSTAEIFDPVANTWTPVASMHNARANHTSVLLQNGTVLVIGGSSLPTNKLNQAEIFDPSANRWYTLPDMPWSAFGLASSLMDDGNVMVSGGGSESSVYDTGTNTWAPILDMGTARSFHSSTALSGGRVLVMGGSQGSFPANYTSSSIIYSTVSGTWTTTTGLLSEPLANHKAVLLNSTSVLIIGGLTRDHPSLPWDIDGTKAMTAFGSNGLAAAPTNNSINILDDAGDWTQYPGIPGGKTPSALLVYHGRLCGMSAPLPEVYVAKAKPSGSFVSAPHAFTGYVINASMSWNAIAFPTVTELKFQIRSARNQSDLASAEFLGPDGTNTTYFSTSGTNIGSAHWGNNWFQYIAYLTTSDQRNTPILQDVTISTLVEQLALRTLVVSPENITITTDETVDFNVSGFDQFGSPISFNPMWMATGGSIDPVTGNYTPRLAGVWKVTARVNTIEGSANVTVIPGVLASIKVTPDKWLGTTDETKVFTAVASDAKGNLVQFTPVWTVSGGGSISQDGNFSPNHAGSWKVYANDTVTGHSGNASALISEGNPASIIILPSSAELSAGEHLQFSAKVYDGDGNELTFPVEWRTQSGGVITGNGNYTAQMTGNWMIYANLSQYGLSAVATVSVSSGPLARILLSPDPVTIQAGQTVTFTATPVDAFGNDVDVTIIWSAMGGGPVSNGQYSPTKTGLWTVYANASGLSSLAQVRVMPAAIAKITVSPGELEIRSGNWTLFSARAEDSYGNVINDLSFVWSVSPDLGTIDSMGGFTAGKTKTTGSVTATATYGNVTVTGTAIVTVKAPKGKDTSIPGYYSILEYMIIGTLIAVVALIMVELSRKGEPDMKK